MLTFEELGVDFLFIDEAHICSRLRHSNIVAIDDFERVGPFKDAMTWPEYAGFLASWMPTAEWDCSLRRITESGNLVFLELEERLGDGPADTVNSSSIYEFDGRGRLRHLDVYLQMATATG